jgi:hypothetical protein
MVGSRRHDIRVCVRTLRAVATMNADWWCTRRPGGKTAPGADQTMLVNRDVVSDDR